MPAAPQNEGKDGGVVRLVIRNHHYEDHFGNLEEAFGESPATFKCVPRPFVMSSVFQVAEITRLLMSVSRICDQGMACIFEKDHVRVVDKGGKTVARFERDGGLYTCTMKLRRPEPNSTSGFARPE